MNSKTRQSNFELLRLICMFFIILHHLLYFFVAKENPGEKLWQVLQLPLHVGVIAFVLISGYFGIKTSIKGFAHLIAISFLYYVPLEFIYSIYAPSILNDANIIIGNGNKIVTSLLFVSHGPYWFIRTYLWLYLFAPMVNFFINQNLHNLKYILLLGGAISIYMGFVGGDPSLADGKNVVNFIFLYCLGRYLNLNKEKWCSHSYLKYIGLYLFLNGFTISSMYVHARVYNELIWSLFFPYCSLGLILNAVLIFMIFGKMNISSSVINSISASTFSMYLFHHHPVILFGVIKTIVLFVNQNIEGSFLLIVVLLAMTLILMTIPILIDWLVIKRMSYVETLIVKCVSKAAKRLS